MPDSTKPSDDEEIVLVKADAGNTIVDKTTKTPRSILPKQIARSQHGTCDAMCDMSTEARGGTLARSAKRHYDAPQNQLHEKPPNI